MHGDSLKRSRAGSTSPQAAAVTAPVQNKRSHPGNGNAAAANGSGGRASNTAAVVLPSNAAAAAATVTAVVYDRQNGVPSNSNDNGGNGGVNCSQDFARRRLAAKWRSYRSLGCVLQVR